MKIYAVERLDKFDYDFSVELEKCGCFYNRNSALQRAKQIYERMCGEYEDEMRRYADEEDEASGKTRVVEDDEYGYYLIAFGHDEDYECHSVAVETFELSDSDVFQIYIRQQRDSLIDDIKYKAEMMEMDLSTIDFEKVAHRAEKSIDNNDGLWESYWLSIEYALEKETEV